MQFTQQQIDGLHGRLRDPFVESVIGELRRDERDAVGGASDEELRTFVQQGMERAGFHGIEQPALIRQYVQFMLWLGPDFDTRADTEWAGRILNHEALSPRRKIDQLENYILSEWEGSR